MACRTVQKAKLPLLDPLTRAIAVRRAKFEPAAPGEPERRIAVLPVRRSSP